MYSLIKKSHLTIFVCQFGRFRYVRLLFGAASASVMFQRKRDKIFKVLPIVFGIADDIIVVAHDHDGTDYDKMLCKVLQTCRKEN